MIQYIDSLYKNEEHRTIYSSYYKNKTVRYDGPSRAFLREEKGVGVTILSFESEEDRKKYSEFWKNNSGMNKAKNCQLGNHLSTMPKTTFKKVYENGIGMNHKGKAE